MVATILICLLSTLTFCICIRQAFAMITSPKKITYRKGDRYSSQARRIARGYLVLAMLILSGLALAGATLSYGELFSGL